LGKYIYIEGELIGVYLLFGLFNVSP